jgi:orotate phosphoribosyltransferase
VTSQERLLELAHTLGALKYGKFTLSSGRNSGLYFDGRLLSLNPEGLFLISSIIWPIIREAEAVAIGGPSIGADPIVSGVVYTSYLEGRPISGFVIRPQKKSHGTGKKIEGPELPRGSRVAIVDDVCTTGNSTKQAIGAAERAGYRVVKIVTVLDRHEGGSAYFKNWGYDFESILDVIDGKITARI